MLTKKFETPFGYFEILHNGEKIEFEIAKEENNNVWIGDKLFHADGAYIAKINTSEMSVGDVIIALYSLGGMEFDGGDEYMNNAIVETENFVIGMGCYDTDELNETWKSEASDSSLQEPIYVLPYETYGLTANGDGFEFRITDDPKKYLKGTKDFKGYNNNFNGKNRSVMPFKLAWHHSSEKQAWEIVSDLTSDDCGII